MFTLFDELFNVNPAHKNEQFYLYLFYTLASNKHPKSKDSKICTDKPTIRKQIAYFLILLTYNTYYVYEVQTAYY